MKAKNETGFWAGIAAGAQAQASTDGVELLIKGTPEVATGAIQLKLLDSVLAQHCDAIVVTPTDAERLAGRITELTQNGVRVVLAETDLPNNSMIPYVGYNEEMLASAAVSAAHDLLTHASEVTIFRSNPADPLVVARDKLIIAKVRKEFPSVRLNLDFFAVTNESGSMAEKAALMLANHPDAKLIIATSSVATDAVLDAVERADGSHSAAIVGFGAGIKPAIAAAIERGTIHAYLLQSPMEIGRRSIQVAEALVRGEAPPPGNLPLLVVDRSNVRSEKVKAFLADQ